MPGVYYLRHVGFLGAQPPAVKGLRSIELAEAEPGVIEFSESGVQTKSSAAALEAENKLLKAEFAQRENAARITAQQTLHSASGAYAEQLVAADMKPLHAPVVIAALDAVQSGTTPLEFGEGDQRQPLSAGLKELFNDLTNPVSFTEVATKARTGQADIAPPANPLLADAAAAWGSA